MLQEYLFLILVYDQRNKQHIYFIIEIVVVNNTQLLRKCFIIVIIKY